MLTQETAKKPYRYQVNCHLKFGDSLHLKTKIKYQDYDDCFELLNYLVQGCTTILLLPAALPS